MNNKLSMYTFLVFLIGSLAIGQAAPQKKMMKELNLTDPQQEQFEKISFDTQNKQIEVRAKIETSKLELRRIFMGDNFDKAAIEKKMNEVASLEVARHMNNINAWSEKNKVLNADQQKIWKKMLGHMLQAMQQREQGRMQGPMMHKRQMMNDMPPRMERNIEKEIIKE